MKNIWRPHLLFLGLCISTLARAQTTATLLVKSDIDCNWKLDGHPMSLLKADDSRAVTTDNMTEIRIEADVDQGQKIVEIQMKDEHDRELKKQQEETIRKQAEADVALHPTWIDPATADVGQKGQRLRCELDPGQRLLHQIAACRLQRLASAHY